MKTHFIKQIAIYCILNFVCYNYSNAQVPTLNTVWEKTFGGSAADFNDYMGSTLAATSDGGYVFAANTLSNDGDVSGNHGGIDCWVVKINATGNLQWQKCLGGSGDDWGKNIIATSDGGILVGGKTTSNDGDISGNHGGASDIFLIKLNATGAIEWEKTLGSTKIEDCYSFVQDNAGNYLIAGITNGNNGNVSGNHGQYDAWVVKLNGSGNILWQKCYGGSRDEGFYSTHTTSICLSAEGGYMLSTTTTSTNGQVTGYHQGSRESNSDAWLVKIDVNGTIQRQNCYGGPAHDAFEKIMQTSSGDYIGSGFVAPQSDKEASLSYGYFDWWVCRVSSTGNLIWSKHYGGFGGEAVHNKVLELTNGDLIVPSGTRSNDFDCKGATISATNPTDVWILKLDATGNIIGSQFFDKPGYQNLSGMIMNDDGSFAIAALTDTLNFTGGGYFGFDYTPASQIWILKLQQNPADTFAITTNSLSETFLCPSISPTNITVNYSTRGTFNSGNVFTAQLSEANSNFSAPIAIGTVASTSSGTISCTIPGNLVQGNYYAIRVVSSNPSFTGTSSGKFISIQCKAPEPNNANNITTNSATVSWSECINSNKNQLKYRKSNSGNWSSVNTVNTNTTINSLSPSTTYIWSVRTKCIDNPLTWSDWSDEQTFTTASLRLSDNEYEQLAITIYPNPLFNSTTISFSLSQQKNVSLKIYDLTGKPISVIADKNFAEGQNQIEFNAEKIEAGIYFLKMEGERFSEVIKLSIVK